MSSISAYWPESIQRPMAQGDLPGTAIELAREGNFIVGLDPDRPKEPYRPYFPHGVKSATNDPAVVQQFYALNPDMGIGLVPPAGTVVLDDDARSFRAADFGIGGTYAEVSPRGFHHLAGIPDGYTLKHQKLPNNAGDLIVGPGRYVVLSPTPGYRSVDQEAPLISLPPDSPLLTDVRRKRTGTFPPIPNPTAEHFRHAKQVLSRLRTTREDIARVARRLLAGVVESHCSPSEADYDLALLASYWTKDPSVILAVLYLSELRHEAARRANGHRPKWTRHDYLPRTIAAALKRRRELEQGAAPLTCVFMGHPLLQASPKDVTAVILAELACVSSAGEFARIPVSVIAKHCGVDRKTVQRHLARLETERVIETQIAHVHTNGVVRKVRSARLAASMSVWRSSSSPGSGQDDTSEPRHVASAKAAA